jgi:hypothetical protein
MIKNNFLVEIYIKNLVKYKNQKIFVFNKTKRNSRKKNHKNKLKFVKVVINLEGVTLFQII